eukprot:31428-Pelagococcus_subviridis.AAC.5
MDETRLPRRRDRHDAHAELRERRPHPSQRLRSRAREQELDRRTVCDRAPRGVARVVVVVVVVVVVASRAPLERERRVVPPSLRDDRRDRGRVVDHPDAERVPERELEDVADVRRARIVAREARRRDAVGSTRDLVLAKEDAVAALDDEDAAPGAGGGAAAVAVARPRRRTRPRRDERRSRRGRRGRHL